MKYILWYLLLINAAAFTLMLVDKRRANKNHWRIRESNLILSAVLGGSVGALAGMYAFRHKTKHVKFTAGIPAILIAQVLLVMYIHFGI